MPDLHAGLGSRFRNAVRPADFAIWTMLLLAAAWASPSLLAAPLVFILWGWWLLDRIGGISGDGHGAGIEIAESLLRSEEHTSELQSLMRISYAVFCLKKKNNTSRI